MLKQLHVIRPNVWAHLEENLVVERPRFYKVHSLNDIFHYSIQHPQQPLRRKILCTEEAVKVLYCWFKFYTWWAFTGVMTVKFLNTQAVTFPLIDSNKWNTFLKVMTIIIESLERISMLQWMYGLKKRNNKWKILLLVNLRQLYLELKAHYLPLKLNWKVCSLQPP